MIVLVGLLVRMFEAVKILPDETGLGLAVNEPISVFGGRKRARRMAPVPASVEPATTILPSAWTAIPEAISVPPDAKSAVVVPPVPKVVSGAPPGRKAATPKRPA